MSVRVAGTIIHIEGAGQVADAEPLLSALLDDRARIVDLGGAAGLHSAILQLLFALRPRIVGIPADAFVAESVFPLLDTCEGQA